MFPFVDNILSQFKFDAHETWQHSLIKIGEGALLAGVCAYGGTYFFTRYDPLTGASYIATVALVSQVVYRLLDVLGKQTDHVICQRFINGAKLFQIPYFFYLLHGAYAPLTAPVKMEIITATAHFAAIPIFVHLGIIAWNDPKVENIAAAMAVMLPLASRLQVYAELFK